MNYDNVNYIPTKETKDVAFTARMTDRTHKIILRIAAEMRSNRAPTAVDLMELGAKAFGEKHNISLSEADVDAYLVKHCMIDTNNN